MPVPCPHSIRVGDVFIAPTFVVTPTDLAEHRERCLLGEAPFEPGEAFRGMKMVAAFQSSGRACPNALVVSQAAESVLSALAPASGRRAVIRDVSQLRRLADAIVGESITPVATVRYRSQQTADSCHLTLDVGVRRRNGRLVARFEVGVEVVAVRRPTHHRVAADQNAA